MSTRANIIITDDTDELIFYRHSDGYPEVTLPSLNRFLDLVRSGQIRDNVGQASGWLILLGADEYGVSLQNGTIVPNQLGAGMKWKCGSYEPTSNLHGDIEFVYLIDLQAKRVKHCKVGYDQGGNLQIPQTFYSGRFSPIPIKGELSVK